MPLDEEPLPSKKLVYSKNKRKKSDKSGKIATMAPLEEVKAPATNKKKVTKAVNGKNFQQLNDEDD